MNLQAELNDAAEKLGRLYRLVEDGNAEIDDVLRERIDDLRASRSKIAAALDQAQASAAPHLTIDPGMVVEFGKLMPVNLRSATVQFRKAYLKSIVNRIEVDGPSVRIIGHRDKLERMIRSGAGVTPGSQMSTEWRSLGESNPCFRRERVAKSPGLASDHR